MLGSGPERQILGLVYCKSHKKPCKEIKTLWYKLDRAAVPVASYPSLQRQLEARSLCSLREHKDPLIISQKIFHTFCFDSES